MDNNLSLPAVCTVEEMIQRRATAAPDARALHPLQSAQGMTYGQLNTLLSDVRQFLRQVGIGRDDKVAVVLPNGPAMATAFVSVSAACVCAPLNPAFRDSEFQFYLSDLGIKGLILLASDEGAARAAAISLGIPLFDLTIEEHGPTGAFTLYSQTTASPAADRDAKPEDLALVLHTSGTTARPKIVPLSHGNICASADSVRQTLQLTPADRCLNFMPLFHIHGLIGALLSSLSAGGSVACCPPFDAGRLFAWWAAVDPTWYTAVPTIHQSVVEQIERQETTPPHASLRLIRSSSSALPPAVMRRLEDIFSIPVLESYGMTEAAHQMASNPLPPRTRKPGSVGIAAGPEMAIMNESGDLLTAGETGEIVIRGANVTAGYVDNPSANAAAFTRGWFRTGDQGWQDEDGYFQLSGRLKELINRGGEKLAPREVDEALLEFPTVTQAVAFAVPHRRLGEDLAAAVVLRDGSSTTETELREFLTQRLTRSKIPSRIVFVNEIPKGGTGKIQRIGLHEKLQHVLNGEYISPETHAEMALAELWRELLNQPRVGVHDNFFWLGGDSLLAGRLVVHINAMFDLSISLASVFQKPTLGEQAALIEQMLIEQMLIDQIARPVK